MQGAEPLFLPDLVCDQICQPSNEDEDEMKINSRYRTDPYMTICLKYSHFMPRCSLVFRQEADPALPHTDFPEKEIQGM